MSMHAEYVVAVEVLMVNSVKVKLPITLYLVMPTLQPGTRDGHR